MYYCGSMMKGAFFQLRGKVWILDFTEEEKENEKRVEVLLRDG